MPTPTECPSADALIGLLGSELEAATAEEVRGHIDGCDACQLVVVRLLGSGAGPGPAPSLIGTTVGERYRVEHKLGAGAMAVVYKAWDQRLERYIALKAIATDRQTGARRFAHRLLRESKAMAKLRHPNVVTVHDVLHSDGHIFLAMELVEGQTLRSWLSQGPRSVHAVLDALKQAGRGLAAAHGVGLVHRDFKPDNVLVGTDGRVLVVDFGLARSQADHSEGDEEHTSNVTREIDPVLTATGHVVGTPAYMAPEQWSRGRVDARCDVFAFCVTAFEALYDRRPFTGPSPEALQASKLARRFEAPRGSAVPASVRGVVAAGLEPEPDRRPQTMAAVLAELEASRPARAVGAAALGLLAIVAVFFFCARMRIPST